MASACVKTISEMVIAVAITWDLYTIPSHLYTIPVFNQSLAVSNRFYIIPPPPPSPACHPAPQSY